MRLQRKGLEGVSNSARNHAPGDISTEMTDGVRRSEAARSDASPKGCLTPAAFAERFEGVSRTLWCIAAAVVGDRFAADDVVQESAMVALGKLEQFDSNSNFLAWMARIVRFTALNHGRRRKSTHLIDHIDADRSPSGYADARANSSDHAAVTGHGDLLADQHAFDDRVLAALNTLDPTARACLLLRVVMNRPYRDIALALDIAEGTAMSHVHRSRMTLRATLSDETASHLSRQGGSHAAH